MNTMRERFDELRKKPPTYEELLDFIEQELKKEREEDIKVIEIWFEGEMNENRGSKLVYEHLAESKDRIINTIKKRT